MALPPSQPWLHLIPNRTSTFPPSHAAPSLSVSAVPTPAPRATLNLQSHRQFQGPPPPINTDGISSQQCPKDTPHSAPMVLVGSIAHPCQQIL
ncbi:hypothetical protein E2562_034579 [Oryza meyeriana var. granulata]|uniref:Uncharacterized protein n=1 Tax=Oryza meyeriana var. granulata TaxID=110450 RepID=A0A6G1ESK0_9ORYZ|nr:hypothetical protein E2562_034579 [Oryza meyeriana var. granulata]